MNKIINTFLLVGDTSMLEMDLSDLNLHIMLVVHSLKIKKG